MMNEPGIPGFAGGENGKGQINKEVCTSANLPKVFSE
jgi:hypothetical protein